MFGLKLNLWIDWKIESYKIQVANNFKSIWIKIIDNNGIDAIYI